MPPRGTKDVDERSLPATKTNAEVKEISSERIKVRTDGRRVCWNCGATLAKLDGDSVRLINGYRLRATAVREGVENPIPVFEAGRKAKVAYRDNRLKAARGDTRAQERLRSGHSTRRVREKILRAGRPDMDPVKIEQKRARILRDALSRSEPIRSTLLAMADGTDAEVAAVIDSWKWVDPTQLPTGLRETFGRCVISEHSLVECLGCGEYSESDVVE